MSDTPTQAAALPPLPKPDYIDPDGGARYWEQARLQSYARQALAAQAQELDALRALVAEMGTEIEDLIDVGSGLTRHQFVSLCPDHMTGHDSRDSDCMACNALIRAQTLLDQARKENRHV